MTRMGFSGVTSTLKPVTFLLLLISFFYCGVVQAQELNDEQLRKAIIGTVITHDLAIPVGLLPFPAVQLAAEATEFSANLALKGFRPWLKAPPAISRSPGDDHDGDLCSYQFRLPAANAEYENLFGVIPIRQPLYDTASNRFFNWNDRWGELQPPELYHANSSVRVSVKSLVKVRRFNPLTNQFQRFIFDPSSGEETEYYAPIADAYSPASDVPRILGILQPTKVDRDGLPAVEGPQQVYLPIGTHTLEWAATTQMNLMTDVFVPAALLSFGVLTEIKNVSVGLKAAKKVKQDGIADNIVNAADNAADTMAALSAKEKFNVFWEVLFKQEPPGNIAKIVLKKAATKFGCMAFDILVKLEKLGLNTIEAATGAELLEAGVISEQEQWWIDAIYQVAIELGVTTSIDVLKLGMCKDTLEDKDKFEFVLKVIVNLMDAFGLGPFVTTDTAVSYADQLFTVWDNIPPVISIDPEPLVLEATDPGGTRRYRALQEMLAIAQAGASDNCGREPLLSSDAPELLPIGTTTVTWTAKDQGPNPADGQDYAPTAMLTVVVEDTQPPLLLAPPSKVIEADTSIGLAAAEIGEAVAVDLADPVPVIVNNAPAIFNLDQRSEVIWAATDDSGNQSQKSQWVTVKTTGTNTAPVANRASAQTLTAKPVDIRLTAQDRDELDGRFDPLWFSIEQPPGNGEFIAPLFPFFIFDYRTRPSDGLGDAFDPVNDDVSNYIANHYCEQGLQPPTDFVHQALFVHVTDSGIRYVLDQYFTCDLEKKAVTGNRISRWDRDGNFIGQMRFGPNPEDTPSNDAFVIDRDGFLYFNQYTASGSSSEMFLVQCPAGLVDNQGRHDTDAGSLCTRSWKFENSTHPDDLLEVQSISYIRVDSDQNVAYVADHDDVFAFELLQSGGVRYIGELGPVDNNGVLDNWLGDAPGMEVGSDGSLYIVDSQYHRIHKIAPVTRDASGKLVPGAYVGWTGRCTTSGNKACDEVLQRSRGYSCTYAQNSCQVGDGQRFGDRQGQFNTPRYLALDPNDVLYVADYGNERVQRFSPDGSFAGEAVSDGSGINKGDRPSFVLGNMGKPQSLSVNSSQFFVVDRDEQFVHVFGTLPFKDISDDAVTVTYVSDQDFHSGTDSFSFTVSDGLVDSEPATVDITVDRNYRPPIALAESVSTNEDTVLDITLKGDDPDGIVGVDFNGLDVLEFSINQQPHYGTLSGSGASWRYTPDPDYYGDDEIRFTVSDGLFNSDVATVSITVLAVNDPPVVTVEAPARAALGFPTLVTSTFTDDPSENYQGELDWADGNIDTTGAIVDDDGENPRIEGLAISPPPLPDLEGRSFAVHTYGTTGTKSIELCVFDGAEGKGCDTADISVEKLVSLGVGATVFSEPLAEGEILQTQIADNAAFRYLLTIVNEKPSIGSGITATEVSLTGRLPVGLPISSIEITKGTCSLTGTDLSCSLGSLSPGEEVTLTVNATGPGGLVFNKDQDFRGELTTATPALEDGVSFFVSTELVANTKDSDGDGMSDIFESSYGLNITLDDSGGDQDRDGLTNLDEFLVEADPTDPDTDGDGMPDGYETKHGLNPITALDANEDLDGDGLTNVEEFVAGTDPSDHEDTPTYLKGTIRTAGDENICALVLASGRYLFSCNPNGIFSLVGLPREQNGTFKRQLYADGFFPKVDVLQDSIAEDLVMTRSGACPKYNAPVDPGFFPGSAGKRLRITGKVLLQDSQTPVCALVLANGQFMFTCDGTGSYDLNIPLDNNGQFKLQVYADGFAPTIQTFDEFKTTNDIHMARAVECQQ